jgi:hypothetical protein
MQKIQKYTILFFICLLTNISVFAQQKFSGDPAAYPGRRQAATDKNKEIIDSKTAYDQFSRQAEVGLQDQVQRMTSNLLADIQAAVGAKAKLAGYSLVLNSSSDAVIFNSGDTDITADVLAQLNAGAPIDVNASTNEVTSPAIAPQSMHNP